MAADPQRLYRIALRHRTVMKLMLVYIALIPGLVVAMLMDLAWLWAAVVALQGAASVVGFMAVGKLARVVGCPEAAVLVLMGVILPVFAIAGLVLVCAAVMRELRCAGLPVEFLGVPRPILGALRDLAEGRPSALVLNDGPLLPDDGEVIEDDPARLKRLVRWHTALRWAAVLATALWLGIIAAGILADRGVLHPGRTARRVDAAVTAAVKALPPALLVPAWMVMAAGRRSGRTRAAVTVLLLPPLFNLLTAWWLSKSSGRQLRASGARAGLLGASVVDLEGWEIDWETGAGVR